MQGRLRDRSPYRAANEPMAITGGLACGERRVLLAKRQVHSRGLMAEWLRSGLQIRAPRFDSGSGLHPLAKFAFLRANDLPQNWASFTHR